MLASLFILPFRCKSKINNIYINILKDIHVLIIIPGITWHMLPITDKNIIRLQIIIDQATLMNKLQNI